MPNGKNEVSNRSSRIAIGAMLLAGLLIVMLPITANGNHITAYAVGNDTQSNGQVKSDHNNEQGGMGNQTAMGNQTMTLPQEHHNERNMQDGNSTLRSTMSGDDNRLHSKAEEMRIQYINETANDIHRGHLGMHAPIAGPYKANMNYTLDASGNATAISDNSTSKSASISLNLSTWKSTRSLVSMDIMNGTITIGGNQTVSIHDGHAYYLISNHQVRLLAYIKGTDNTLGSNSHGNETSPSSGAKLLKLIAKVHNNADETTVLPTSASDKPLQISILSPQSKLASEWFLGMTGEVKQGSSSP